MFLHAFVAKTLTFSTFIEFYLGNYAFKQNDESLAAHQKSSAAHSWTAAHLLRNTALHNYCSLRKEQGLDEDQKNELTFLKFFLAWNLSYASRKFTASWKYV